MYNEDDNVPRSVRLADIIVIFSGFIYNLVRSLETFAEEMFELAIYNANRETKVSRAWEQFTQDLEKMEEENG